MNKVITRLLLFFVGIPAVVAIILFLPHFHYLSVTVIVLIFSVMGTMEMAAITEKDGYKPNIAIIIFSGVLFPVVSYLSVAGITPPDSLIFTFILLIMTVLGRAAFIRKEEYIAGAIRRASYQVLLVVYPGFFLSYLVRFASLEYSGLLILLFLGLIFANDSLAYAAGSLWGKGSRRIFLVSPNKSVVGFIGGIAGAVLIAVLFWFIQPALFNGSLIFAVTIAVIIALIASLGDLIESAFKRSVNIKDSGNTIPGRGGVLDSIDSVLFCAPLFFYVINFIQSF